jgi:hypothetical protein
MGTVKPLLAAMLLSAPLSASEMQFGVRGAYAPILGLDAHGAAENFDAFVPIALEVGYRPKPQVYLGLYLGYSFGVSSCPLVDRPECSGHAVSFGGQARYSFSPGKTVRPFIGFSLGYQRLLLFGDEEEFGPFSVTYNQIQLGVEAGLDLYATPGFSVGPYVAAKLSEAFYGSATQRGTTQDDRQGGGYLTAEIGLRISFSP